MFSSLLSLLVIFTPLFSYQLHECSQCGLQCHSCVQRDFTLTPKDYIRGEQDTCTNVSHETCTWGHHCSWTRVTVLTSIPDIGVSYSHIELSMNCVNDTVDGCAEFVPSNRMEEGRHVTTDYKDCYQWFCFHDYCNLPNSNVHLFTLHSFIILIVFMYLLADFYYSLVGTETIQLPVF